jgi:hypothetical protein
MVSEYVAWVDVMGTQSSMSRSINITANFIFKLHIAAIRAKTANIQLYPVMDGFYAACGQRNEMLDFLRTVFLSVADEFNHTAEPQHRFIIRGGLAFGPVIHGRDVGPTAPELANDATYRNAILLGMPMVQAHVSERDAPPFGIYVHESARVFSLPNVDSLHWVWWRWGSTGTPAWDALKTALTEHLAWCRKRAQAIMYSADRIDAHHEMVNQYFAD